MSIKYASPLRYPGGKASLACFLADVIDLNDLRGGSYYEPYAGGAGAALTLLLKDVVSVININDADIRIFSFWHSILNETDRFIQQIHDAQLTIDYWHQQKEICSNPSLHDKFTLGFSAFFLNRCNRSGVLLKAGPIGGYKQEGKWTLDVRYNKTNLEERIAKISSRRDQINITNLDAVEFLKQKLPKGKARKKVFVYLDPPYVNKAKKLYLNSYEASDHIIISKYLDKQIHLPWLLSYDDTTFVRNLYQNKNIFLMPIVYSLQKKRSANELIITPKNLTLPKSCNVHGSNRAIPIFNNTP